MDTKTAPKQALLLFDFEERESFIMCVHLYTGESKEIVKLCFPDNEGDIVWEGDMLCSECIEQDLQELFNSGLILVQRIDDSNFGTAM